MRHPRVIDTFLLTVYKSKKGGLAQFSSAGSEILSPLTTSFERFQELRGGFSCSEAHYYTNIGSISKWR